MSKRKIISRVLLGLLFIGLMYNFYTTFSLNDDYSFKSDVYLIEDGMIKNISPYTDIKLFLEYFDIENCTIAIKTKDNQEIKNGYIPNLSQTIIKKNNEVLVSYTNIVSGDITEDGKITEKDLEEFGKYLVNRNSISKELYQSLDINKDNEIHLNDLMLLEYALNNEYQDLTLSKENMILQEQESERVVANIKPSYGLNTNAKWISNNSNIAVVTDAGIITGVSEGETTIKVQTADGKISKEVAVKVDNTIQLSSYSGNVYQEADDLVISVKAINYDGITCSSSDDTIVSCRIENKHLYLSAGNVGNATITVTSPEYGSKTFQATSISPYISLQFTDYECVATNQRPRNGIIISTMNAGKLSFDISDNEIIEYAYAEGNRFLIKAGTKTGRGEVIIKGSNSNRSKKFTLDVYKLSFPSIGGIGYVGEEIIGEMIAEGIGELTCTSPDETIATCRIEDNKLYVQALNTGEIRIKVTNTLEYNGTKQKCGEAEFLALIRKK